MRLTLVAAMLLATATLPACAPAESATETSSPSAATIEIAPAPDPILNFAVADITLSMTFDEARASLEKAGYISGGVATDGKGATFDIWKIGANERIVGLFRDSATSFWKIQFMQDLGDKGDPEVILTAVEQKYGSPDMKSKEGIVQKFEYGYMSKDGPKLVAKASTRGLLIEISDKSRIVEARNAITDAKRKQDVANSGLKF